MSDDPLARGGKPGDRHYRAWVGNPTLFDVAAAMQFTLLTALGLREDHYLLDVGCGSLRAGRLFIPYLLPGRYHGIEPEAWLVEEGIERELGRDILRVKEPVFSHVDDFRLTVFGRRFDYILAHSILSHTGHDLAAGILGEARETLQPGGAFVATHYPPDGSHRDQPQEGWVYPGVVAYSFERLQAMAKDAGLSMDPVDWPHPSGQSWVVFTVAGASRPQADLWEEAHDFVGLRDQLEMSRKTLQRLGGHPAYRAYRAMRRIGRKILGRG
ncbi:MAG: class I SAM-dependent methyltransferase [Actinobacteria bacterium]|nr:class I SAM-dependent methyltransferase [Actinomycetota bacterium]